MEIGLFVDLYKTLVRLKKINTLVFNSSKLIHIG